MRWFLCRGVGTIVQGITTQHPHKECEENRWNPDPEEFVLDDGQSARGEESCSSDWRYTDWCPGKEDASVIKRGEECHS